MNELIMFLLLNKYGLFWIKMKVIEIIEREKLKNLYFYKFRLSNINVEWLFFLNIWNFKLFYILDLFKYLYIDIKIVFYKCFCDY